MAALQGHGVGAGQGSGQPGCRGFSLAFGKEVVGTDACGKAAVSLSRFPGGGHRKKALLGARDSFSYNFPRSAWRRLGMGACALNQSSLVRDKPKSAAGLPPLPGLHHFLALLAKLTPPEGLEVTSGLGGCSPTGQRALTSRPLLVPRVGGGGRRPLVVSSSRPQFRVCVIGCCVSLKSQPQ